MAESVPDKVVADFLKVLRKTKEKRKIFSHSKEKNLQEVKICDRGKYDYLEAALHLVIPTAGIRSTFEFPARFHLDPAAMTGIAGNSSLKYLSC